MPFAIKKDGSGFRRVRRESDTLVDEVFSNEEPSKSPDVMVDASRIIQGLLDDQAQALGYDNMLSALSYINDPCEKFATEAKKLADWRSACWVAAFAVKKPKTVTEVIKALPKFPG